MNGEKITQGKLIISEFEDILHELSDSEVGELLDNETLTRLLKAIFDTSKVNDFSNIPEFFLANKTRSTIMAWIRLAIHQNFSIKAAKGGK